MSSFDFIIVGGGFFGSYIANFLANEGKKVVLIEKNKELMQRASHNNQARVHGGYHYPRSILTALRSRELFSKFTKDFESCVVDTFDKYYMVAKSMSKVNGTQFEHFCERIGASLSPAPPNILKLTNKKLIENVYLTQEFAFDAQILKQVMMSKLEESGVKILFETEALGFVKNEQNEFDLHYKTSDSEEKHIQGSQIINCTYANINQLNRLSAIDDIPLKLELTEICLVQPPEELKNIGITTMCGPFFSIMPFPSRGLHSFTHVRYTPHHEWNSSQEQNNDEIKNVLKDLTNKKSAFKKMMSDSARFIPCIRNAKHIDSLWEVKALLPRNDRDDGRPILFKVDYGTPGYHCVVGGKIDNIYDAVEILKKRVL